jgi:hypothetical protein
LGSVVDEAFDLIRLVARMVPLEQPGQSALDAMIAAIAAMSAKVGA